MRNRKKPIRVKEPVHIREKESKNGNKSLYLDIYWKGKRKKKYLNMHIIPERTPMDREHNNKMYEIARVLQSQATIDLQRAEHGLSNTDNKERNRLVIDYIQHVANRKKPQTKRSYDTLLLFMRDFAPNRTFKDVDKKFCLDFIDYLKNTPGKRRAKLSPNTQVCYLRLLKVVFNCAVEDEIILRNPFDTVNKDMMPHKTPTEVAFLTIDEVRRIEAVETPYIEVKQAYLFCCYTGLRFSDVKSLTWGQLRQVNNETILFYGQKKTQKQEYLPLAKPALNLLAVKEQGRESDLVFNLTYNRTINLQLKRIAAAAGINGKKVTFHTSRHTAGTLLVSKGVPEQVIQEILGHSDISTTQIYAKVLAEQIKSGIHKLDNL
jgi:site-specific recombinase XerD